MAESDLVARTRQLLALMHPVTANGVPEFKSGCGGCLAVVELLAVIPALLADNESQKVEVDYLRYENERLIAELAGARKTWNLAHEQAIAERDAAEARIRAIGQACTNAPDPMAFSDHYRRGYGDATRAIDRLLSGSLPVDSVAASVVSETGEAQ